MEKELIIAPRSLGSKLVEKLLSSGVSSIYTDPRKIPEEIRERFRIYFESDWADVKVSKSIEELKPGDALWIRVEKPDDLEMVRAAARIGASAAIVEAGDWKIIPLENLVADLQGFKTRLIAVASDPGEVEALMGVLEKGVDGVLLEVEDPDQLSLLLDYLRAPSRIELEAAEVLEVMDVGMGDRACIDTVSILRFGEGMLVGNTASLLALIHNESIGSSFTAPRPFRVNAGAIHSYTLMPDGSTSYLSELSSGRRVMIVSVEGGVRVTAIGRVKIERRPMRFVKLRIGDLVGSATVQNAETIRFIKPGGELVSITELEVGDRVLAHRSAPARHFGRAVEEFVIER